MLMERNTGPVNTILIGSRAWNKNFAASNETDWDLIVTENQLEEILARRSFYHYRPHLEYGKLSVVHQGGAKLEFEVMEKLTSDQILKSLAKERKETIMLQNQVKEVYHNHTVPVTWPVQANIPSKEALLTLKASHIYFPINWRKNFLQLVSMMSSFAKSFSKVIKEDPHSSLLKELFQTRARETLHRVKSQVYLSVQRIHAPSVDQLCDSCKGVYDIEFKFKEIVQTKEDPSDTFYLPTTGLKLSKSDWLKLGTDKCHCEDDETDIKSSIICEQLILLALYYYLPQQRNFGFLSNLKKEDQINELFMLCIETFVTQQLVPVTRVTDHHTEFTSCLPMTGADIMAEVEASNIFEPAPLASNSELLKTTFANPIINWLIDSLSTHYEALRTSFAEFMIKTQRAREELFVHTLNAIPNLPFEVIEMIKSSAPNDHVLLSKLCRVCKSWNKYFSEEAKWKPLCDRFDKNTRELAEKHIKSARRRVAAKTMFRECYEMMSTAHTMNYCKHCRDLHERCSGYNVTSIRFEREGRCACPQCNAGSGQICPYYNDFLFSNEH